MTLDLTDWQNKKYQTFDGRQVRILCIDGPGYFPIVGTIEGQRRIYSWTLEGGSHISADMNLENVKTKKSGWLNIYSYEKGRGSACSAFIYETESLAKHYCEAACKARIFVEWEE